MPFNLGLLSEAGLADMPEATRDELQKQATKQFIVGSLLGGDPSMAFRSAIDVPNQYVTSQQRQLTLQKAREEQDQLNQFRSQFIPTATDANAREATARSVASDFGLSNQGVGLSQQLQSRPVDVDAALKASLGMSGNAAQSRIVENLKAMTPQFRPEIGAFTTAGGRVTGTVPLSDKSGMTRQYNPNTGQWEFGAGTGATRAVSELESAVQGAKPQEVYDSATGTYKVASTAQAIAGGLPIKPGPGMEKSETKTAESLVDKRSNFPTAEKGINAYVEQTKFLENTIDQAIGLAKQRGTTGLVGAQAAKVQGTPAYNLRQLLDPIRNGTAFDTLKDLKANDASLGQIAVKEFEALASSKGSVDQGQTDAQLIQALTSLKDRLATGRDRVTGEYYSIYKDFALTPERIAPIVEQARQNPLNVPPGFQVRAVGQEQYLVGPNKFFQKIK